MSCVLLEHVKHGSMTIWYIILYYIIQYLQIFLQGRAPEICLSSTLFKTTGDFLAQLFSWNGKSAKLKQVFFLEELPL